MVYPDYQIVSIMLLTRQNTLSYTEGFWTHCIENHQELSQYSKWPIASILRHIKFKPEFKERVRKFFGRVCVECGAPENGRKLDVHHVNFDKSSCCSDVKPLFVALCRSCHMKTNTNREHWEDRYTQLINEKFEGKCYFPKEV